MEATPARRLPRGLDRNGSMLHTSTATASTSRTDRLPQPVQLPRQTRLTGPTLAGVAAAAGVAAIALGGWAFVSSVRSGDPNAGERSLSAAEQVIPLLARPNTERIPVSGSAGRMTLFVGAGGRGVLVLDGLEPAPERWSYRAWITELNAEAPVPAAVFSGTEVVVPLTASVPREATVGITIEPEGGLPAPSRTPKLLARRTP
jgi:hypothetical protein